MTIDKKAENKEIGEAVHCLSDFLWSIKCLEVILGIYHAGTRYNTEY